MTRIPIATHPSNLDASARIVSGDRAGNWTIYAVEGGFVLISDGMAAVGIYPTEAAALEALAGFGTRRAVH